MSDIETGPHSAAALFRNTPEAYGENYKDHLLEQYKLYVESAQNVSEKRISASNYLLTVSSSILTVFGLMVAHTTAVWLAMIPVAGLLVSLAWFAMVRSYKNLNTAKFKVIHELEERLPAALFAYEWHHCDQGEGTAYKPITHIERWIPGIFAAVYVSLLVLVLAVPPTSDKPTPHSVSGTLDVTIKNPDTQRTKVETGSSASSAQNSQPAHQESKKKKKTHADLN